MSASALASKGRVYEVHSLLLPRGPVLCAFPEIGGHERSCL